ncbi:hypothetical protein [Devosia submarina]|uniref:hypothetical protein n=1 Tax=Devosia submarina TaxID=1173082 RepID=UPI0013008F31|nr:hypothetical protein [Devosia submarina]
MPATWKMVIATLVFGVFAYFYNSMANGGHAAIWAMAGIAYGAALALISARAKHERK